MVKTRSSTKNSNKSGPPLQQEANSRKAHALPRRHSTQRQERSNGLETAIKKQLIADIEKAGGIAKLCLASPQSRTREVSKLLDKRQNLFEDVAVRKQATSFIQNCRKLAKRGEYYERVLKPLQIEVPRSSSSSSSSSKKEGTTADSDNASSSSSSSSDKDEILLLSKSFSRKVQLQHSPTIAPSSHNPFLLAASIENAAELTIMSSEGIKLKPKIGMKQSAY